MQIGMTSLFVSRLWHCIFVWCCVLTFAGCERSVVHHYDLKNGKSIEVYKQRDGRVRTISLHDEAGSNVLRIAVEYDHQATKRVSFWDSSGKLIDETLFSSDRASFTAGPISNQLRTESASNGVTQVRIWTYKSQYVVYSERNRIAPDGRLLSKVVCGPYGYTLQDYHSGENADSAP